MSFPFYVEPLSASINSYELKKFRVQHDERQLTKYLCKKAKKHEATLMNKTFLVREKKSKNIVAFFSLKAATLPYKDSNEPFLIPAIELTHFAVDERYKNSGNQEMRTGEFIFWNHIIPKVKAAAENIACKNLFVFSIDTMKLIKYYKNRLNFREIENIDDSQFFEYAKPEYDSGCKFLYFPLGS